VTKIICGVDVSSEVLDIRIGRDGPRGQYERTPEGIERLASFCKTNRVELVVMEATGGYERLPFVLLWQQGISCAIVNPRCVRRFAEAMGFLEKTDQIDCCVIAWFAEVKRIVAQQPSGETQILIGALVTRLRQLTEVRTAQSNQRRLVTEPSVLEAFVELIALINRQIRQLEKQIAEMIEADPLWTKLNESFRTIKGVADRTVARILAEMPEIGTLSNKAVSKLGGLAPLAHDSGKSAGKRAVRGGRANVRSILFIVAEVVRRYDPDFAAFHKKLSDAGKPKKLIRVALAHKLLVRLNAKARDVRLSLAVSS